MPKSPERLPVDKADATLEELEALPNGEALRAADAIKESGIAGSESNSANNRFVLFVTKFFFRKETPWEAGKHKGDTRFITPHMAAINHFPEQAMRSPRGLGASTRYLCLNGSGAAGRRAGGGVSAGRDREISD